MTGTDIGYYERRIRLYELENTAGENRAEYEIKMLDIYHGLWYDYLTELRYNPYHDPSNGRFCSGGGGGYVSSNTTSQAEAVHGAAKNGEYNPADIRKAITQKGTNFVTEDINNLESLYGEFVENIPPKKGYYDIKCHGTSQSVKIFDSVVDANELAKIILMRNDYGGEPIRLLSCETGKGRNCFAKQLSDILQVDVEAPTEKIWARSTSGIEIGTKYGAKNGEMKLFKYKK